MARKRRSLTESLSVRSAKVRRQAQSHRLLRWIGGRGVATLVVGAALSVGGVSEALQGVAIPAPARVVKQQRAPKPVLTYLAAAAATSKNEPVRPPQDGLLGSRLHLFEN